MSDDPRPPHTPEFVTAEVDPKENGRKEAADPGLVPAQDVLPERLILFPADAKPVFPGMVFPLILSHGSEADLLRHVAEKVPGQTLGFVLARETEKKEAAELQFYRVGTLVRILKLQINEDGIVQALLQGRRRFRILSAAEQDGHLMASVEYPEEVFEDSDEMKALTLAILGTLRNIMKHNPIFSEEMKMALARSDWGNPGRLADFAAALTSSTREELQEILDTFEVRHRLNKVLLLLRKELDINELKEKISHQIEERISKQQREFFLREQLRVIKQELGLEKEEKDEELERHLKRLDQIKDKIPEEARKRIEEEIGKLKVLPSQSPEYAVSKNYLDWLNGLPWSEYTEDKLDVANTRKILDRDHYGLDDVKKRILEFVGVAKLKGSVDGSILCFVGPPGVGKTSIGKAIAEALGRKFFRFSLGGMRDEAEIKGHRRTYIGAMPGKFIQAMKVCGSSNPVVMLDEIDKVGASYQGDPASALLEVLDPEQNVSFRDHYLDVPFDLSKVLFIATANVPDTIPPPLLDRMEVIRLSGYILDEKLAIANRHLVPKSLPKNGLDKKRIAFSDDALRAIVDGYAREAGVRNLEKAINRCMRKVASEIAEGKITKKVKVEPDKLNDLLGKPMFEDDPLMKERRPGVVMGLAWTAYGGSTLYIEAAATPGKGGLKITGQVGSVMNESSQIAYSMLAATMKRHGLEKPFFEEQLIHLHIPAGATPKDGPSAGITMATALLSLGLQQAPPPHLAMTGELTLTGRVLPVGGIKEKIIAARRSGVKRVILPSLNQKDFDEIPAKVRQGITPHFVETYDQVVELVFGRKPAGRKKKSGKKQR